MNVKLTSETLNLLDKFIEVQNELKESKEANETLARVTNIAAQRRSIIDQWINEGKIIIA